MKKFSFLLSLLTVLGLYSCSQEDAFLEGTPSKGLTAGIPAYEFDSETRLGISENLHSFTWSDGDQIGIYGEGQYGNEGNAAFTIKNGGSNSGVFTNDIFALKPNSTYYAFYPYDSKARIEAYPVDFTGQVQTANGSTAHIGARNYMSAEVNTDANGVANISFQNLAAVIQVIIPIEEDGNYTGVTLSTKDADFTTHGTLNMKTGAISSSTKSQQMILSLGTGISKNVGDKLTVNVLVAPVDLSGKFFSVTLETNVKTYHFDNLEGMNIQKGKAYKVDCKTGEIEETPYLTFTANGAQTLKMSYAVNTLEYSVNGGDWQTLGTNIIPFGDTNGGDLRLRGKARGGTATWRYSYSKITFGNATKVACSGDIRTLIDYENYKTVDTSVARFICLFSGCKNLTSAPSLPSTSLADNSYCAMFENCSNLTSSPELPATTLAAHCYDSMFSGCTSLTNAPSLPAETLADFCYYDMFHGCSSLTSSPELPATTLASSCYSSMFYGCNNLMSAPELPATTLASSCYSSLFYGCSSLTNAPSLPATIIARGCYISMFSGCSSLTSAPELPATSLAESCYNFMFSGCTSLTSAPDLPATTLASSCYSSMFSGCKNLTSAPSILPAPILASSCYYFMFNGCSNLISAPALPSTVLADHCYYSMFSGCTSLTTAPELPATTLADYCYNSMFHNCISLTKAPELPATTLVDYCYSDMFKYCKKLNYIKMMATDISAEDCLDSWSSSVASTGTFIKNEAATWSNDALDDDGDRIIPSGWTVQTATE